MIEYTDSGLVFIDDVKKENFDKFVIVDSQPSTTNVSSSSSLM